jgi:CheY-like chemotaxis protein
MMTELVEAKEKAEEMNEIKSNFLANMSHELRTPLHGILGFAQILSEEINDDELQKMANVIYKSGNRLLDTLNLLLNFSKAETSKIETVFSDVIIKNLFDETVELFKPFAESKGLSITAEISNDNIILHSDERLLREILNNLINNAIKFTENGVIFLSGTSDESNNLVIKIKDTGIGIPQNKHELIFQEFRQESEGLSRNFEGTGLGLTLTKRYVEILGGSISIESEVGIGTLFSIGIPDNVKVDNIEPNEFKDNSKINIIPAPTSKKRLLLVENDKVSAMLVNTFVKKEFDLDIVANGGQAIIKVSEKEYDAILMDINLGDGITGLDAAQKIKHLKIYKDTPIIAVTAFAMEKDKEEFLKYGCTHYLAKPFEKTDLLQLLKLALNKV